MLPSELFHNCAFDVEYKTVGKDVNYAFDENAEEHTLTIYFQGSSSSVDWIRNFLFKKKPYKDMEIPYRVHRGFLAAWKEVEDTIITKIKEKDGEEPKWKRIITVGYSHGGALAALCHECVWFHRPDLRDGGLSGWGFEAPRIYGGWKVKKELGRRWESFVTVRTNGDLVTHCPPSIFGFCHVGDVKRVKGDVSLSGAKWYVPNCIKSHYPQVVYDALKKYESRGE